MSYSQWSIRHHVTHGVLVLHELLHGDVLVRQPGLLAVLAFLVQVEDAAVRPDDVVLGLWVVALPRVLARPEWGVDDVVWRRQEEVKFLTKVRR